MDERPCYYVAEFMWSDRNTDSDLTVICNGKRFYITLSADDFEESPSIKESYIHYLQVAEAFELDGLTVDDFYDWALEPFLPIFRDVPPLVGHQTLQQYLFPETVVYALRAVKGELVPFLNTQGHFNRLPNGVLLNQELCSPWPSFYPQQVQLCDDTPEEAPTCPQKKVLVNGNTCFFKAYHVGDYRSAKEELSNYKSIEEAGLEQELRISRLYGLVRDDDSGRIYGLLLSYIDCRNVTLACAMKPTTPSHLQQQWASQITHTLNRLHNAGIVWGDVKPDNVLIDVNKDSWIIDFGGSYTEGWVEKEIAGTVQGDLQGLAKILEYLGTGSHVEIKTAEN
ncbi:hypothetical protein K505DRAFT_409621 [Melanomma pulvis-pyrius CBS 109.77]|uniref:Protein kinase domain-containing protein n=1 Tax=Melanomma pulvis-pyrius CBS 109.77 TaxID=1314802 RepID=A0A6A6X3T2_9PLEO|nr:hypothetical protein K505DRAFT_409621 [Melanomma pulvis-pyrius CBS 109.77]